MQIDFDVLIVGGGFAGIFAAWRLAHAGRKVALIEQSPRLGGTLWSKDWNGYEVDLGMHNFDLRGSPDAEFYEDILGDGLMELQDHNWASTTGGNMTPGFEMPDVSTSDPLLCKTAIREMDAIWQQDTQPDPKDLTEYFQQTYGKSLGDRLGAMAGKVTGRPIEGLSPDAATTLGMLARPKLGTDPEMVRLKKSDPFWDARLGVTLNSGEPAFLGRSVSNRLGYPASGSLRGFCIAARDRLEALGVTLRLETTVTGIEVGTAETTLRTDDGPLTGAHLFWSLPDQPLLTLLGLQIDLRSAVHPVGVAVHAFEVHAETTAGPDYLQDFDIRRRSYRYSRPGVFGGQITPAGRTYVLAEVPCHPADAQTAVSDEAADVAWQEMKSAGFIDPAAEHYSRMAWSHPVAYTLPVMGWQGPIMDAHSAIAQASSRIVPISFGKRGRAQFIRHFDNDLFPRLAVSL